MRFKSHSVKCQIGHCQRRCETLRKLSFLLSSCYFAYWSQSKAKTQTLIQDFSSRIGSWKQVISPMRTWALATLTVIAESQILPINFPHCLQNGLFARYSSQVSNSLSVEKRYKFFFRLNSTPLGYPQSYYWNLITPTAGQKYGIHLVSTFIEVYISSSDPSLAWTLRALRSLSRIAVTRHTFRFVSNQWCKFNYCYSSQITAFYLA